MSQPVDEAAPPAPPLSHHGPEPAGQSPLPRPAASACAAELRDLLAARQGERHLVAIQDFPDPDAISSAMAYQEIARALGVEADVVYEGLISHPENLALVNLLEIKVVRYQDGFPLERYNAAVFVDNQGTTTRLAPRLREAGIPALAVIDHHDPQDYLDPVFTDIRPVAAAATLLTEYLRSGLFVELDPSNLHHAYLATALMHGLHSETDGFIRAARPEYEAAAYLSNFSNGDLLEQVLCVQKSRGTMDTIQAALAGRTIRGGMSLAGVGYVRWADRDAVPQAADFLLTEENVHTAIVYGMLEGDDGREIVSGSLRTTNATLGVDAFLKRALGEDIRGKPYGGGRSRAGGFEIDTGFLSGTEDDEAQRAAKWRLFDQQTRRKLFAAAGLDNDKSGSE